MKNTKKKTKQKNFDRVPSEWKLKFRRTPHLKRAIIRIGKQLEKERVEKEEALAQQFPDRDGILQRVLKTVVR